MPKPSVNVALKTAMFSTNRQQQLIARAARIAPQKLSHVVHGRRDLDPDERKRLIHALERFGVQSTEVELFGQPQSPQSLERSA